MLSEKEKKQLDAAIKEVLVEGVKKSSHKMVWHQISVGGKRIRPALAIECCKLLDGKFENVLYPAAGLEILHNYTLIVDDIIDNSVLRRNQPTAWVKYSTAIAQCIALHYSAAIFQAAQKTKKYNEVSKILCATLKKVSDGEIKDILYESNNRQEKYVKRVSPKKISQKQYFEMIALKTASLIEASCWLGGVCASANEKQIKAFQKYGFNLGIAFQIQDDILDIFGEEEKFGKKIGKDFEEKKRGNIIFALSDEKIQKTIERVYKSGKMNNQKTKALIRILKTTNVQEKARKLALRFSNAAIVSLSCLPDNKHKNNLIDLANFVVSRQR